MINWLWTRTLPLYGRPSRFFVLMYERDCLYVGGQLGGLGMKVEVETRQLATELANTLNRNGRWYE